MTDKNIIKIVRNYLLNKNFKPNRLKLKNESKPDFEVEYKNGGFFYCEVKSPILKLDKDLNCYKHSTTHSKLNDLLHKAVKQFKKVNLKHIVPKIIIWTSNNFQLNWSNFFDSYKGYISINGHDILRDFRKARFYNKVRDDWVYVDCHIWLQLNRNNEIYEEKLFMNNTKNLPKSLINLLESS